MLNDVGPLWELEVAKSALITAGLRITVGGGGGWVVKTNDTQFNIVQLLLERSKLVQQMLSNVARCTLLNVVVQQVAEPLFSLNDVHYVE